VEKTAAPSSCSIPQWGEVVAEAGDYLATFTNGTLLPGTTVVVWAD